MIRMDGEVKKCLQTIFNIWPSTKTINICMDYNYDIIYIIFNIFAHSIQLSLFEFFKDQTITDLHWITKEPFYWSVDKNSSSSSDVRENSGVNFWMNTLVNWGIRQLYFMKKILWYYWVARRTWILKLVIEHEHWDRQNCLITVFGRNLKLNCSWKAASVIWAPLKCSSINCAPTGKFTNK